MEVSSNLPHAKQAALRRAVGILVKSSVQMQSPSSLLQVSMWPRPVLVYMSGGGDVFSSSR
jgi:hypothetical protein